MTLTVEDIDRETADRLVALWADNGVCVEALAIEIDDGEGDGS